MRRFELVGKEGGYPPIMVRFEDDEGRFLGLYVKLNILERPHLEGPLFQR